MTAKQRDLIRENVAESRRLGERADKAADKVVRGLRGATARPRVTSAYRSVGGSRPA